MRSAISTFILLSLALNGIVCACPASEGNSSDTIEATHSRHSGHDADNVAAENCHGDQCSSDCDELTASKTHRQVVVINHYQAEPELDEQAIDTASAESIWPTGSALRILLHVYQRFCASESPVTLKDRLLH